MARQTQYIVQAFLAGKGSGLKADRPVACKTSADAIRRAQNSAQTKLGIVAYETSGDAELGDYDERPVVLFKAGRVPQEFEE